MMQRAKRHTLFKIVDGSDEPLRLCHKHGFLPFSAFHKSSLTRGIYDCSLCVKASRLNYYNSAHGRSVKCAAEIRRREGVNLTAEVYSDVVNAWGNMCFVTGAKAEDRASAVTLIIADPENPFSVTNCAPCARPKARELCWKIPSSMLAEWKTRFTYIQNSAVFAEPAPPASAILVEISKEEHAEPAAEEPAEPAAVEPAEPAADVAPADTLDFTTIHCTEAAATPVTVNTAEPRCVVQPTAAPFGGLYKKGCIPVRRDDAALLAVGRARYLASIKKMMCNKSC